MTKQNKLIQRSSTGVCVCILCDKVIKSPRKAFLEKLMAYHMKLEHREEMIPQKISDNVLLNLSAGKNRTHIYKNIKKMILE